MNQEKIENKVTKPNKSMPRKSFLLLVAFGAVWLFVVLPMLIFAVLYIPALLFGEKGVTSSITVNKQGVSFNSGKTLELDKLELANDPNEWQTGLMYRKELCEKCGMLFVFDDNSERAFWMKNTLIPLDIAFIDEKGKVISISENTKTNQTDEIYRSKSAAKYVLEVNAGYSSKYGLKEGDSLDIEKILSTGVNYDQPDKIITDTEKQPGTNQKPIINNPYDRTEDSDLTTT